MKPEEAGHRIFDSSSIFYDATPVVSPLLCFAFFIHYSTSSLNLTNWFSLRKLLGIWASTLEISSLRDLRMERFMFSCKRVSVAVMSTWSSPPVLQLMKILWSF